MACNYSFPSIFCTRREKNPFHWEWGAWSLFIIFLVILFPFGNVASSTFPEDLTWKSVFSFWLVFHVLVILITLFCFLVEFLPQITTLLTDLGASQAEVSWKNKDHFNHKMPLILYMHMWMYCHLWNARSYCGQQTSKLHLAKLKNGWSFTSSIVGWPFCLYSVQPRTP